MHADGMSISKITDKIGTAYINERFVERSVYEGRQTKPRVSQAFPTFEEYVEEATQDLDGSGMVWDRIESMTPLEFDDYVYDFTVDHPDHNFIANGFVVSNCGVRLIRTNLDIQQLGVEPKGSLRSYLKMSPAALGQVARFG